MSGSKAIGRSANNGAGVLQNFRTIPAKVRNRILDRSQTRAEAKRATAPPSLKVRQHELVQVYDQFERLVETICDSAQYGPEPALEAKYAESKAWMSKHYGSVRVYVAAYLEFDPADAKQSMALHATGEDAIEALYCAPNLREFLSCDDGRMIERILRARTALTYYGDHLRQLIAAEPR